MFLYLISKFIFYWDHGGEVNRLSLDLRANLFLLDFILCFFPSLFKLFFCEQFFISKFNFLLESWRKSNFTANLYYLLKLLFYSPNHFCPQIYSLNRTLNLYEVGMGGGGWGEPNIVLILIRKVKIFLYGPSRMPHNISDSIYSKIIF